MRPTARGVTVVVIAALAFVFAATFGQEGLNAVAAPALIALLAGAVQVRSGGRPEVERMVPAPGFPNDARTMRIRVDANGPATVTDRLGRGLRPREYVREISGATTVEYEFDLVHRGAHDVGPLTVTAYDALGLFERTYRFSTDERVLVYPEVRPVTPGGAFAEIVDRTGTTERQAFDDLREYAPGDALRDIHWKSSAKRQEEFVVMEFADEDTGTVAIACEAAAGDRGRNADRMATATASIAAYLLDHGVEVALTTPGGHLDRGLGDRHRLAVLELLARTPPGRLGAADLDRADVRVSADARGRVTVDVRGRTVSFDDIAADRGVVPA
ncbi:DUF58 domain-containing protein [Halomarina halobia]|uniref:DUF58 domain-containing protein n=1 Tax=Halomarina halobia TaxID=3033386 RepID=A0ABD6AA04_9EURY|nr:DUF58 domain-containing protein [Halomarina sp. PSR21]